ncbi:STAS domain-containing protein [Streptomyces sp. NPDC020802]|uniref:STAS domain-containing protein n=1 Tax=Streptomyces sp. NPDC020802 TaxID=3365094 RepID=UPI0037B26CA2
MTDNNQKTGRSDRLAIDCVVVDGVRVVTVRGEIDHEVKDVLGGALMSEEGAVPPLRVVADLSGVTFMDSSGINTFVAAHRHVRDVQGWLRIAGAREPVMRVLQIVGLDTVVTCHPTTEQALNA